MESTPSDVTSTMKKAIKFNTYHIFSIFQAHEKEVSRLQQEIDTAREQKDIAIKRVNIKFLKNSLFSLLNMSVKCKMYM